MFLASAGQEEATIGPVTIFLFQRMFGGSLDHRCGQDNEGIVSCVNYGFFVGSVSGGA